MDPVLATGALVGRLGDVLVLDCRWGSPSISEHPYGLTRMAGTLG